jgi:hypothetical protein
MTDRIFITLKKITKGLTGPRGHSGVDARTISFDRPPDGLQHAKVDCVVRAYSANGKLVKANSNTTITAFKPATYAKVLESGFPCSVSLELPAGMYGLRLGVRDDRTGIIGTSNARVNVPETVGARPVQSKP